MSPRAASSSPWVARQRSTTPWKAIAAAPAALAQPNCSTTSRGAGGATEVCESPGNAQISSTPGQYAQPWYGGGFFPWEGYGPYIF